MAKRSIEALVCPIFQDDIDTDALLPVSENTRLSSTGFGDALFAAWRYADIAARLPNPDFILNRSPFCGARILIGGGNFGSGSSRESAVWALRDFGFEAVIAVSFNETFRQNCISNAIWPLAMDRDDAFALVEQVLAAPRLKLSVDLEARLAKFNGEAYAISIDDYFAHLLQNGMIEDDLLETFRDAIAARLALGSGFDDKNDAA